MGGTRPKGGGGAPRGDHAVGWPRASPGAVSPRALALAAITPIFPKAQSFLFFNLLRCRGPPVPRGGGRTRFRVGPP